MWNINFFYGGQKVSGLRGNLPWILALEFWLPGVGSTALNSPPARLALQ